MSSIDVVIHCCEIESFGRVIAESLISKTPVIGVKATTSDEFIIHGKSGFLVDSGDIISYQKHLNHLLNDAQLRMNFGKYGELYIKNKFSPNIIIEQLTNIYHSTIINK